MMFRAAMSKRLSLMVIDNGLVYDCGIAATVLIMLRRSPEATNSQQCRRQRGVEIITCEEELQISHVGFTFVVV